MIDPHKPPKTTWEEIVFEHRNKSYGAYQLRAAYQQQLFKSMALSLAGLLSLLFWLSYGPSLKLSTSSLDTTEVKLTVPLHPDIEAAAKKNALLSDDATQIKAMTAPMSPHVGPGSALETPATSNPQADALEEPPRSPAEMTPTHEVVADQNAEDYGSGVVSTSMDGKGKQEAGAGYFQQDNEVNEGYTAYFGWARYMTIEDSKDGVTMHFESGNDYHSRVFRFGDTGNRLFLTVFYKLLKEEYGSVEVYDEPNGKPGMWIEGQRNSFTRVHDKYIVNIGEVLWVDKYQVYLDSSIVLPIDDDHRETLRQGLGEYAEQFAGTERGRRADALHGLIPTSVASRRRWENGPGNWRSSEDNRRARIARKVIRREKNDTLFDHRSLSSNRGAETIMREQQQRGLRKEIIVTVPELVIGMPPPVATITTPQKEAPSRQYGDADITIDLTSIPVRGNSVFDMLSARVPGMIVSGNKVYFKSIGVQTQMDGTGKPQQRTGRSIGLAGEDPLYLLNGSPVASEVITAIPPELFASVDIMYSGGTTAFFGSRGANGVISFYLKN